MRRRPQRHLAVPVAARERRAAGRERHAAQPSTRHFQLAPVAATSVTLPSPPASVAPSARTPRSTRGRTPSPTAWRPPPTTASPCRPPLASVAPSGANATLFTRRPHAAPRFSPADHSVTFSSKSLLASVAPSGANAVRPPPPAPPLLARHRPQRHLVVAVAARGVAPSGATPRRAPGRRTSLPPLLARRRPQRHHAVVVAAHDRRVVGRERHAEHRAARPSHRFSPTADHMSPSSLPPAASRRRPGSRARHLTSRPHTRRSALHAGWPRCMLHDSRTARRWSVAEPCSPWELDRALHHRRQHRVGVIVPVAGSLGRAARARVAGRAGCRGDGGAVDKRWHTRTARTMGTHSHPRPGSTYGTLTRTCAHGYVRRRAADRRRPERRVIATRADRAERGQHDNGSRHFYGTSKYCRY